jgi:hypothetical protein
MTIRSIRRCCCVLALACVSLVGSCAQDKKYEGISVSRGSKDNRVPYIYNAIGSLDFDGQNPVSKANKVMLSACPHGQPTLMLADAPRLPSEAGNRPLLIAMFTCDQLVPGVE